MRSSSLLLRDPVCCRGNSWRRLQPSPFWACNKNSCGSPGSRSQRGFAVGAALPSLRHGFRSSDATAAWQQRSSSSGAEPPPQPEQLASDAVARCEAGVGLLMRSGPRQMSADGNLKPAGHRGQLLQHDGQLWVCLLEIDRFWFAVPVENGAGAAVECLGRATPTQADRAQLHMGFTTGVAAVDVLAPIGRGQSMLICGPPGTGKSSLCGDVMSEALSAKSTFTDVIRFSVEKPGLLVEDHDHTVVEVSSTGTSLTAKVASLYSAVAGAEAARDGNRHALLIIDSLAPLIEAWDTAQRWVEQEAPDTAALNHEAIASQRRAFFAGLLERAANLTRSGSLTLLIAVETSPPREVASALEALADYTLEDFASRPSGEIDRLQKVVDRGVPLNKATIEAMGIRPPRKAATETSGGIEQESPSTVHGQASPALLRELQSLSDGQIILSAEAASKGHLPAVVVGATLSRFGLGQAGQPASAVRAQPKRDVRPPALQAVAAHLRTELALEEDKRFLPSAASSSNEGTGGSADADIDASQSAQLHAVKAALLQPLGARLRFEETTALLLAACSGALNTLDPEKRAASLRGGVNASVVQHLKNVAPQVLEKMRTETQLSQQTVRELDVSVRLFAALAQAE